MDSEYTGESSTAGEGPVSTTWSYENGLSPAPPRRGSAALLQDIGGLLGPRTRIQRASMGYELETILQERNTAPTSHPSLTHAHSMPPPIDHLERQQANLSFQDVGGLLER